VDYLMNRAQALRLAMENEQRAHDFYADIARNAPDPAVRELAAEFAEEEKEHLDLLIAWREKIPESEDETPFDPDPAHMPE
jgi:rubrerythrin